MSMSTLPCRVFLYSQQLTCASASRFSIHGLRAPRGLRSLLRSLIRSWYIARETGKYRITKRLEQMLKLLLNFAHRSDRYLVGWISKSEYGSHLMSSQLGRRITEILFLTFVAVLSYETIYHTGIYLNLWEHHAKHIFKEIPVHCAHVYVDVNFASAVSVQEIRRACASRNSKSHSELLTKALDEASAFKFPKMVRYHLEFGPDDFENNADPDLGSTIGHLRQKILSIVKGSEYFASEITDLDELTSESICIINRKGNEIPSEKNHAYLVHCDIETGNKISCVIIV